MKRLMFTLIPVVLACAWLGAMSPAEDPNALTASGGILIGLTDPGNVRCIGGEPTGWPLCSQGTQRIVWRGLTGAMLMQDVIGAAAEYVSGVWVTPGSCNLDGNYRGPCWGTFEASAPGGGKWQGTWNAVLDFVTFGGTMSMVGTGSGSPAVEGLHIQIDAFSAGSGDETAAMPFTARVFQIRQ